MGHQAWSEEGNTRSLSDLLQFIHGEEMAGESDDTPRFLKQYEEQQKAAGQEEAKPLPVLTLVLICFVLYFIVR